MENNRCFVSESDKKNVPFNYVSTKYMASKVSEEGFDIVRGRHKERTYINKHIQNPFASKQYFYKAVSRYATKL